MKYIGVVGYSAQKFDEDLAKSILNAFFDSIEVFHKGEEFDLVSGLTNMGIPAIAYRLAEERDWNTTGVACKKAEEYECFAVDELVIVGEEWGDESETFLDMIDILIRVGGGKQSLAEAKKADEMGLPVLEVDLPAIKD